MNAYKILSEMHDQKKWKELVREASDAIVRWPKNEAYWCFLAVGQFNIGMVSESFLSLDQALLIRKNYTWAILRKYDFLSAINENQLALNFLNDVCSSKEFAVDDIVHATLADKASAASSYSEGVNANQRRYNDIQEFKAVNQCIVVQIFNKADTVFKLLNSLINCRATSKFNLIIVQDNSCGSKNEKIYETQVDEVFKLVGEFYPKLVMKFASVRFTRTPRNLGTCRTCEYALDLAIRDHDRVILIEDDVVFSPDAFEWFEFALTKVEESSEILMACGESIYFNDVTGKATQDDIERVKDVADDIGAESLYGFVKFAPSSCFASTKTKIKEISGIRGLPRGDVMLCQYMVDKGLNCIMPVVPRASDIGMHNDRGYSVALHGKEKVDEKRSYLFSKATDFLVMKEIKKGASDLFLYSREFKYSLESDVVKNLKQN